jgi:hypothetical protein
MTFGVSLIRLTGQKKGRENKVAPAVKALAKLPVASICLFADKLSAKLFQMDTRAQANT